MHIGGYIGRYEVNDLLRHIKNIIMMQHLGHLNESLVLRNMFSHGRAKEKWGGRVYTSACRDIVER